MISIILQIGLALLSVLVIKEIFKKNSLGKTLQANKKIDINTMHKTVDNSQEERIREELRKFSEKLSNEDKKIADSMEQTIKNKYLALKKNGKIDLKDEKSIKKGIAELFDKLDDTIFTPPQVINVKNYPKPVSPEEAASVPKVNGSHAQVDQDYVFDQELVNRHPLDNLENWQTQRPQAHTEQMPQAAHTVPQAAHTVPHFDKINTFSNICKRQNDGIEGIISDTLDNIGIFSE